MELSPAVVGALERIDDRARDALHAFTPGAQPAFDDAGRHGTSYATMDPLSVALPDNAYFVERSGGELRFTRNASLQMRDDTLCAGDGRPVLGESGGRLGEIRINRIDGALGRSRNVRIATDGTVTYERTVVDPRNGARENQRIVAGRLSIARFAAGMRLLEDDAGAFRAPRGVTPEIGTPESRSGLLRPMRRETSDIDLDESIDRLREAYVQFDAVQAIYQAAKGAEKSAMDLVK